MVRIARGEEVVDSAMQVIANAVTVEQLRQAQAVVLPLRFAMSLQQTAEVTGLSVGWVSKQRNRFIQGKAVGDGTVPARGGRRRQNLTANGAAKQASYRPPQFFHCIQFDSMLRFGPLDNRQRAIIRKRLANPP